MSAGKELFSEGKEVRGGDEGDVPRVREKLLTNFYLNLTNGLEYAPLFNKWKVCRIRSTLIEKEDWSGLILDLDYDLLFRLARGEYCIVFDCGCRREVGKVVGMGVTLLRVILEAWWIGIEVPRFRNPKIDRAYHYILDKLRHDCREDKWKQAKEKLNYFRWLVVDDMKQIELHGLSIRTEHDGDREFYRGVLENPEHYLNNDFHRRLSEKLDDEEGWSS